MGIYIKGLDIFPARVSREAGVFEAAFVDIPGCRGFGATAVEAEVNARRALGAHMDMLGRHGRALPLPSVVSDAARTDSSYVAYIEGPERLVAGNGRLKAA